MPRLRLPEVGSSGTGGAAIVTRRPVESGRADVQLAVQVSDLPSVQRVLTLLVARGYALAGFSAARQPEKSWSVQVRCQPCDADLLVARLLRFPSVLEVALTAPAEPPDGPAAPGARPPASPG